MRYYDYDPMLKYIMDAERKKSVYYGDSSIYLDGRQLEIFPEGIDNVNYQFPLFVFGTVVYLMYNGKLLVLQPKKDDRVVDTLTGLGGKVRSKIGTIDASKEKIYLKDVLNAYKQDVLDTAEDMKDAAAREVMEETSTYGMDEFGRYTHSIIKEGIRINPASLIPIGTSRVRIINSDKTECWMIQNYSYPLSEEEYLFIENNISKSNREGDLLWLSVDEVLLNMSYADQLILKNRNGYSTVTEIRDNVNNNNIIRIATESLKEKVYGTLIDGKLVYCTNDEYSDFISVNPMGDDSASMSK